MRTLYISDLDGTLIDGSHGIPPEALAILNPLIDDGLLFTVATGRSVFPAVRAAEGLHLRLPGVFLNGAIIADPATGRTMVRTSLAPERAAEVIASHLAAGLRPYVHTLDADDEHHVYHLKPSNAAGRQWLDHRASIGDKRFRRVDDLSVALRETVMYLTVIEPTEDAPAIVERLGDHPDVRVNVGADLHTPEFSWVDAGHADATKGRAVRRVAELVGADRIVCFGDELNDVTMFEAADAAYAVSNAHPDLKALATEIIGAHSEMGVAVHLRSLWAART